MVNRKRKIHIGFRVTEKEYVMICRKVEKSRLPLREFMLRCVQGKEILVKEGGHEVVIELKRIGNNLNQLAHAANAGMVSHCGRQLDKIYDEVREVRRTWQSSRL
ncbi:MobC family plasmid mobilization relaxosome protein [Christensenellaceae bacterium OttesenSCG-928-K19]|nr:MobC family plasmid mobilization relaxosome protein [Christensenellaceae bacterium OttesenSCG-928-K19]